MGGEQCGEIHIGRDIAAAYNHHTYTAFPPRHSYSLGTGITRGAAELQIHPRKISPHTYGYAGGGIFN